MVDAFLDWLAGLPTLPTYAVLMVLSAVENVFPPVPADVAVALGAFLAQRGEVSAPLLGVLCWLANTSTAAAMYYVGRKHGESVFRTAWGRRLMPPPVLAAVKDAYDRHGVAGIFVSRLLPGVRAAVTPFAGVVGMSPLRALVPTALASALWYALLVAAGSALGLNWESVRRLVERANTALGVVALLAAAAFAFWVWRRVRKA
jgi:membrane protein DedA with SNARE-associated domain